MEKGLKLFLLCAIFIATPVFGAVKDSDADGLTDEGERALYQTDPYVYDTDGDGVGDGEEILDGTNPIDPVSSRIVSIQEQESVGFTGESEKFSWYLGRVSGIVSFILFSLVVIYGLFVSNARTFVKWIRPPTSLTFHRYLSFLAVAVVLVHAFSFLFDNYLHLTIAEMLVPFFLDRPFETFGGFHLGYSVATGILAFYIMIMLVVTAELRKRKLFARSWRKLHYFSFVGYILFVAHGFTAGSDSGQWWMQAIYITSISLVGVLVTVRIWTAVAAKKGRKKTTDSIPHKEVIQEKNTS